MPILLLTAIIVLASLHATLAGFVNNYGDWHALGAPSSAYIIALWDHQSSFHPSDDDTSRAYVEGLQKCGTATKITSGMLVEAIDRWHALNTSQ